MKFRWKGQDRELEELEPGILNWIIRKLDTDLRFAAKYENHRFPVMMLLATKSPAHLDIEIDDDESCYRRKA